MPPPQYGVSQGVMLDRVVESLKMQKLMNVFVEGLPGNTPKSGCLLC